jgi:hypothetical protein
MSGRSGFATDIWILRIAPYARRFEGLIESCQLHARTMGSANTS